MRVTDDDIPTPSCAYSTTDFTLPAINDDTAFLWLCPMSLQEYYPEQYSYSYPTFNPNNSDEIAFLRRDNTALNGCNYELWTFNFCTGEAVYLTDAVCYSLDWSVKDWIAFTDVGRDIWKIKADGDSLTRLTNTGSYNNFPIWNATGDRIAFKKKIGGESYFIIMDSNGISQDTIFDLKQPSFFAWSSNDNFSCSATIDNQRRLAYFDLTSHQLNLLHELEDNTTFDLVTATAWSKDNQKIFWTALITLNTTDILTGERNQIWPLEQSTRQFHNLDVSPDGETLIIERRDYVKLSECEREVRENLYLANIDGTNERKIVFPE